MKIQYIKKYFKKSSLKIIEQADKIIEEYQADGYSLTLRQLYYQFVSRDYFGNKVENYRALGHVINDARLAGLISWQAIEDRTRNLKGETHWDDPSEIVGSCVHSYREDIWEDQKFRPEVWIEKDALLGLIEKPCKKYDVDYFSCRGFNSQSEMWRAATRIQSRRQITVILHLGDHDPSGIDMSRDIEDRLKVFGVENILFRRIALNWGQVTKYKPPPNPAKSTDSRFATYKKKFGTKSWELDALSPKVMAGLVERNVLKYRDEKIYKKAVKHQEDNRQIISDMVSSLED